MASSGGGFLAGLIRFITFRWLIEGRRMHQRADAQFTGSADGIAAAYDIQQDQMVQQFKELQDAVAQVETVIEDKRAELERLNAEEETVIARRDGALAKAEQVGEEHTDFEAHAAAYERFDGRITEIEARQQTLEEEIEQTSRAMERHLAQLTKMQGEIQGMSGEKAQAIAEFVSNQKLVELNERLTGVQTSFDRGPLDAVRKANRELSAKARISEKLAGADVAVQDAAYEQAGKGSSSRDKLRQQLAKKRGDTQPQEEETPVEQRKDDRPDL